MQPDHWCLRPTNMNWAAMVFWFQHVLVLPRFLAILEKKEEADSIQMLPVHFEE